MKKRRMRYCLTKVAISIELSKYVVCKFFMYVNSMTSVYDKVHTMTSDSVVSTDSVSEPRVSQGSHHSETKNEKFIIVNIRWSLLSLNSS